jgi:hypothetical protein
MPMPYRYLLAILALLSASALADPPREAGWLQSIRLEPHRVRLTAKLDTGAKSSSLHANDLERYSENGIERVRFSLFKDHGEQDGAKLTYDLPVERLVRIKRGDGLPPDERVTVELSFCLDGEIMQAEFSLDDRAEFNYPVLLGRSFLAGRFVVNPAEKFVFGYDCPSKKDSD